MEGKKSHLKKVDDMKSTVKTHFSELRLIFSQITHYTNSLIDTVV